jgi:3'-phosphoadenosine 5'-phosphosulfate sulfotransferase (PAPS reductase)/FAD synthetase
MTGQPVLAASVSWFGSGLTKAAMMKVDVTGLPEVLSFGGGVNSTALAILLVDNGWWGRLVFCDTGCEWPETYCYMQYFEAAWLRPRGLEIVRLAGVPWQRYDGGVALIDYCEARRVIPMAAVRWCTSEWKVKPMQRYLFGEVFDKRREVDTGCIQAYMLGISAEEAHRKPEACRPLVDWDVDRDQCETVIAAEGLAIPRKSGCYICPFQRQPIWRELWKLHPDLFERAARLEENARNKGGDDRIVYDPHGTYSLRDRAVQFANRELLPGLEEEDLSVWRPCECGV